MIAGLSFLAPFALIALAALPALYFLLKITPPPPRRLPLPTLPLWLTPTLGVPLDLEQSYEKTCDDLGVR